MLAGFVLAMAVMRAAWAQRERETLTAADLRAVEESAMTLIEQLRSEADNSLSHLGARCAELRQLIDQADARIRTLNAFTTTAAAAPGNTKRPFDQEKVLSLASSGMDSVDIARATGLDCAEVKAALRLSRS